MITALLKELKDGYRWVKRFVVESVTDEKTGRASHAKVSTIVACTAFTYKILTMDVVGEEMMMIYMGSVGGLSTFHKLLRLKFEKGSSVEEKTQP